jgi:hypothetical protein
LKEEEPVALKRLGGVIDVRIDDDDYGSTIGFGKRTCKFSSVGFAEEVNNE